MLDIDVHNRNTNIPLKNQSSYENPDSHVSFVKLFQVENAKFQKKNHFNKSFLRQKSRNRRSYMVVSLAQILSTVFSQLTAI